MDAPPILNQENNQLLLNAIKNKFAAKNGSSCSTTTTATTTASSSFSPPAFTIPALKTFNSGSATIVDNTSAKLNLFILGQLSEQRHTNCDNVQTGGFTLPKLTLGAAANAPIFSIPLLSASTTNLASLNKSLNNLKVSGGEEQKCENQQAPLIDLTTALSSGATTASSRLEMRTKAAAAAVEQFEISFVECDRENRAKLSTSNEYCQTDVSDLQLRHSLVAPSACGRIICLSYARAVQQRRFRLIAKSLKTTAVKHKIQRFCFDIKSPDDLVLATLNKYTRKSHT